jgi:hypothetical protein
MEIKITRIEIFANKGEAFLGSEFNDENGTSNFGKWIYGDDIINLDNTKSLTIISKYEGAVLKAREDEKTAIVNSIIEE